MKLILGLMAARAWRPANICSIDSGGDAGGGGGGEGGAEPAGGSETAEEETPSEAEVRAAGVDDSTKDDNEQASAREGGDKPREKRAPAKEAPKKEAKDAKPQRPVVEVKPPGPQRHTLKWKEGDGDQAKEIEKIFTQDELVAMARKRNAADERFQEAARIRQEAQHRDGVFKQAVQELIETPDVAVEAILAKKGQDPIQFYADNLARLIEERETGVKRNQPTPRQLALERELEGYRTRDQRAQEAQEVEREKAAMAKQFTNVLGKIKVPANELTLSMLARSWATNQQHGYKLTDEELAMDVQEQLKENLEWMVSNYDGEELLNRYPQMAKKFVQAMYERQQRRQAKGRSAAPPRPAPAPEPKPDAKPKPIRLKTEAEINRELGIS